MSIHRMSLDPYSMCKYLTVDSPFVIVPRPTGILKIYMQCIHCNLDRFTEGQTADPKRIPLTADPYFCGRCKSAYDRMLSEEAEKIVSSGDRSQISRCLESLGLIIHS